MNAIQWQDLDLKKKTFHFVDINTADNQNVVDVKQQATSASAGEIGWSF